MDFGKLSDIEGVDFRLPPEPPGNEWVLERYAGPGSPQLLVGATGYNMKPWVGSWYPAGTKERDFLTAYGKQFDTIENNTTHYRIPDAATVARWREETPADFRFCPKIPQTISHARDWGLSGRQVSLFAEAIAGLEEKTGCCFIQLPPFFSTQDLIRLERFFDVWPAAIPLAAEVRHGSFFAPTLAAEQYFSLFEERGIATVITDVAGRRDVWHIRLSTRRVLIRFVGNGLHPTDYQRIDAWVARLKHWLENGLQEVYFFTHEPDNLLAPDLASYLVAQFSVACPEIPCRGPQKVKTPGEQTSLF